MERGGARGWGRIWCVQAEARSGEADTEVIHFFLHTLFHIPVRHLLLACMLGS